MVRRFAHYCVLAVFDLAAMCYFVFVVVNNLAFEDKSESDV